MILVVSRRTPVSIPVVYRKMSGQLDIHNLFVRTVKDHGHGASPTLVLDAMKLARENPIIAPMLPVFRLPASKKLQNYPDKSSDIQLPGRDGEITQFLNVLRTSTVPYLLFPPEVYLADLQGNVSGKYVKYPETMDSMCKYINSAVVARLTEIRHDPELLRKDKTVLVNAPEMLEAVIAYLKAHLPPSKPTLPYEYHELTQEEIDAADPTKDMHVNLDDDTLDKLKRIHELSPDVLAAVSKDLARETRTYRDQVRKAASEYKKQIASDNRKRKVKRTAFEKSLEDEYNKMLQDKEGFRIQTLADLVKIDAAVLRNLPLYGEWIGIKDMAGDYDDPDNNLLHFHAPISNAMEHARIDFDNDYAKHADDDMALFALHARYGEVIKEDKKRGRKDPGIVKHYVPGLADLIAVPDEKLADGSGWRYIVYPAKPLRYVGRQMRRIPFSDAAKRLLKKNLAACLPARTPDATARVHHLLTHELHDATTPVVFPPEPASLPAKRTREDASLMSSDSQKPTTKKARAAVADAKEEKEKKKTVEAVPSPVAKKTKKRARVSESSPTPVHKKARVVVVAEDADPADNAPEEVAETLFGGCVSATQTLADLVAADDRVRVEEDRDRLLASVASSEEDLLGIPALLEPDTDMLRELYQRLARIRDPESDVSDQETFEPLTLLQAAYTLFHANTLVWREACVVQDKASGHEVDITSTALAYLRTPDEPARAIAATATRSCTAGLVLDKLLSTAPQPTIVGF